MHRTTLRAEAIAAGEFDIDSWYVIYGLPGEEEAICIYLSKRLPEGVFCKLLVPKREKIERRKGVKALVPHVMFPGYVLVGTDDIDSIYKYVKTCSAFSRILGGDDGFQQIRPEEIARIVYMTDGEGVIRKSTAYFDENGIVRVTHGPLKGYDGCIIKVSAPKERVLVRFMFNGESHTFWLGMEFLDKESACLKAF